MDATLADMLKNRGITGEPQSAEKIQTVLQGVIASAQFKAKAMRPHVIFPLVILSSTAVALTGLALSLLGAPAIFAYVLICASALIITLSFIELILGIYPDLSTSFSRIQSRARALLKSLDAIDPEEKIVLRDF